MAKKIEPVEVPEPEPFEWPDFIIPTDENTHDLQAMVAKANKPKK